MEEALHNIIIVTSPTAGAGASLPPLCKRRPERHRHESPDLGTDVSAKAGMNRSFLSKAPSALLELTRWKAALHGHRVVERGASQGHLDHLFGAWVRAR